MWPCQQLWVQLARTHVRGDRSNRVNAAWLHPSADCWCRSSVSLRNMWLYLGVCVVFCLVFLFLRNGTAMNRSELMMDPNEPCGLRYLDAGRLSWAWVSPTSRTETTIVFPVTTIITVAHQASTVSQTQNSPITALLTDWWLNFPLISTNNLLDRRMLRLATG